MALRAVVISCISRSCPAIGIVVALLSFGLSTYACAQTSNTQSGETDAAVARSQTGPLTGPLTGLLSVFRPSPIATEAEGTTPPDNGSWHEKTAVDVEPSAENWIGFEGYPRVASLYAGATWSPLNNLRQDGLRLRVVIGGSDYRYGGHRFNADLDQSIWQKFVEIGRAHV